MITSLRSDLLTRSTECMKLMTDRRVRHLPVIGENDSVMGLVSLGDLVKYVITSQREEIEALHAYIASGA